MLPVLIYGAVTERETRFLVRVCEEKGIAYCVEPDLPETPAVRLQHQAHHFTSAIAAGVYLDALVAENPLVPDQPDQLGAMWEILLSKAGSAEEMERTLAASPYLAGEALTLADLFWQGHWQCFAEESPAIRDWLARLSLSPGAKVLAKLEATHKAG
ncbi:hypothetical protein KUV89_00020 [Marinobacter hydrocarbonoclasticus]|nr:hypothetical protein [Marinobacter nauticus]